MSTRNFNNVVLTGACGGLGQALARSLLAGGARVALVGLNSSALQDLAATAPGRCAVYTPDVSDAAAMARDMKARYEAPLLRIFGAEDRSAP